MNLERCKIEETEGWREWVKKVPEITFRPEWAVKVIPPFSGAMVRFVVRLGENTASVYLDCHNALGYFDGPYWEVYPVDEDVGRVAMDDVAGLLDLIDRALSHN